MTVLYLIPTLLSENTVLDILPQKVVDVVRGLQQFVVEDVRTARRFLSKLGHPQKIDSLLFRELNEHSSASDTSDLLPYLLSAPTGLLSDAGAPAVADPGASLVLLAHENNIRVVPLAGASSILMALMASGLNGQSFAFAGYLPIKKNERCQRIQELERRAKKENQTQIFIETPYRNMQLLQDIVTYCHPTTRLTIAADITGAVEFIKTKSIRQWKNSLPQINKIPAVFLIN